MARTSLRDHQSSRQPCPPRRAGVIGFISRHRVSVGTLAVVAIAIIAFVLIWFQPQKLFLNQTVNEAVPGAPAVAGTTPSLGTDGSTNHPPALGALPSGRPGQPGTAPGPTIVASGGFRSLEHATTGGAQILQLADGRRFLRLVDLHTSNGPELRVYLSEIPASGQLHAYGSRFIDLGALKGNIGSQNYEIPGRVDLARYRSAVIWCRRFSVGFGVASLRARG